MAPSISSGLKNLRHFCQKRQMSFSVSWIFGCYHAGEQFCARRKPYLYLGVGAGAFQSVGCYGREEKKGRNIAYKFIHKEAETAEKDGSLQTVSFFSRYLRSDESKDDSHQNPRSLFISIIINFSMLLKIREVMTEFAQFRRSRKRK